MTEDELKAKVDEIIKRTRNQDAVDYADVDMLIAYIDLLEFKLAPNPPQPETVANRG